MTCLAWGSRKYICSYGVCTTRAGFISFVSIRVCIKVWCIRACSMTCTFHIQWLLSNAWRDKLDTYEYKIAGAVYELRDTYPFRLLRQIFPFNLVRASIFPYTQSTYGMIFSHSVTRLERDLQEQRCSCGFRTIWAAFILSTWTHLPIDFHA